MDPMQWLRDDIAAADKRYTERFDAIEEKMDILLEFKWKIVGGTVLASLILSTVVTIVFH